jgi:predicted alpha/beta hydrolase family esterase
MDFVIVPGIDNSGDLHWQSLWEEHWGPRATRIEPASWTEPDLDDWCAAITAAAGQRGPDTVLVTHSLGGLAATEWLVRTGSRVRGAFLVAPPDTGAPAFPRAAPSFRAAIPARLPVPAVVIASADDPYCSAGAAVRLASAWDVPLISAGARGHLNTASGIGDWQAGRDLLTAFTAGLRA